MQRWQRGRAKRYKCEHLKEQRIKSPRDELAPAVQWRWPHGDFDRGWWERPLRRTRITGPGKTEENSLVVVLDSEERKGGKMMKAETQIKYLGSSYEGQLSGTWRSLVPCPLCQGKRTRFWVHLVPDEKITFTLGRRRTGKPYRETQANCGDQRQGDTHIKTTDHFLFFF